MTKIDQRLHPGEFFLERRDKHGKWDLLSRDNDGDVMRTRFEYAASMLAAGEAAKLSGPDLSTVAEKEFDSASAAV